MRKIVYRHKSNLPSTQNAKGDWVPAIPLPFYLRCRKQCSCGQKFWTTEGYRGHYAYAHILGMED